VGECFFWYRLTWVLSVHNVVHNCHTQHRTILIIFHLILQTVITAQMISTAKEGGTTTTTTRHRASTSMYSLTFCIRFLLPERHQWKPAVQAAAVMLRMPPSTPITSEPATCTSYIWRTILRTPPSPASSAHRPRPAGCSHYDVISRDGRKLVTRIRVMLP